MPERSRLAVQFQDPLQQQEAATLGLWIFLATEVLFFGALFTSYAVYRSMYPAVFGAGSRALLLWAGATNTAVLLTSSLTMALAVHSIHQDRRRRMLWLLLTTACLGVVFLCIKGYEYYHEYREHHVPWLEYSFPGAMAVHTKIFFYLYFLMTGLHALHLIVGISVVGVMALRRNSFSTAYFTPVELTGLYWHFVDIVWVFLFPLLYLVRTQ